MTVAAYGGMVDAEVVRCVAIPTLNDDDHYAVVVVALVDAALHACLRQLNGLEMHAVAVKVVASHPHIVSKWTSGRHMHHHAAAAHDDDHDNNNDDHDSLWIR